MGKIFELIGNGISVASRQSWMVVTTILGVVWLLYFYVFTTWVSVGTLSSMQIREAAQVKNDSGKADGPSINTILAALEQRQEKINKATHNLEALKLTEDEKQWDLGKHERGEASKLEGLEEDLFRLAKNFRVDAGQFLNDLYDPPECSDPQVDETVWDRCTERDILLSKRQVIIEKRAKIESSIDQVRKDISAAQEKLDAAKLFGGEDLAKYGILSSGLLFMLSLNFSPFLVMPDELLRLLLTMSMGALGSVMHMTWEFLNQRSRRRLRWYLLHPFIGAISAIVIFVFLKAGQITISSPGSFETLNPFFLSFVGIVSGLLSDRAYERVLTLGSVFLGATEEEGLRWGFGLKAAMVEQHIQAADLAPYLGVKTEQVDAWANQKERLTRTQQSIIASFFRRSPRRLFSDLGPGEDILAGHEDLAPSTAPEGEEEEPPTAPESEEEEPSTAAGDEGKAEERKN